MTWELTPELENSIVTALENGEGLNAWCKGEGRPSRSTVLRWQRVNFDFETKCAHAREAAGELAAEEHYEIAKDCLAGNVAPDVAGRVLSAMQWRAAKLASKKFGDTQQVRHADADGNKLDMVSLVQTLDGTSTGLPKIGG